MTENNRIPLGPILSSLSQGKTFPPLVNYLETEETPTNERPGGLRAKDELPELFFFLNSHPRNRGSGFFSIGNTKVSVAVSGPQPRLLNPSNNTNKIIAASRIDASIELSIQYSNIQDPADTVENFLSDCIQNFPGSDNDEIMSVEQKHRALGENIMETLRSWIRVSQYPNSTISINVLVLNEDDGNLFPCIINAISLAIMQAQISVNDVLAAVSVYGIEKPNGDTSYCLGLDGFEMKLIGKNDILTTINLAFLTNRGLIAHIEAIGPHLINPHDRQLIQLAQGATNAIGREISQCITADLAASSTA